jgi:GNAT superfamily N-acetyltransferase
VSNRIQLPNGAEILFRELTEPVASWSVPRCRWVVEWWDREEAYPFGQAWVFVSDGSLIFIDWLEVPAEHRRKGIGTALMDAIRARWPQVSYEGATDLGEAFLREYDAGARSRK